MILGKYYHWVSKWVKQRAHRAVQQRASLAFCTLAPLGLVGSTTAFLFPLLYSRLETAKLTHTKAGTFMPTRAAEWREMLWAQDQGSKNCKAQPPHSSQRTLHYPLVS